MDIDQLVRDSAPRSLSDDETLRRLVDDLVDNSLTVGRRPALWRRPLVIAPTFALLGAAITAAAIAFNPGFEPDTVIPIDYVTDTGVAVSCHYYLAIGGPDQAAIDRFLTTHDWSGIGQRVYDEAIARPFDPEAPENVVEPGVTLQQAQIDEISLTNAFHVVLDEIPLDLFPPGSSASGNSDCTGRLH